MFKIHLSKLTSSVKLEDSVNFYFYTNYNKNRTAIETVRFRFVFD